MNSFLRAFLLLALGSDATAVMYQFVVQFTNAPPGSSDLVYSSRANAMANFFDAHPAYAEVDPGMASSSGGARALRGNERELQISQCPKKCSSSGANYCRSIGCAYCGGSCSRRLAEMSQSDAAALVSKMDTYLMQFCGYQKGCKIWATIYT